MPPRPTYTLTTSEAAAIIGCHVVQVRRLAAKGKIKARRYSSRLFLYDLASVTEYANRVQVSGWPRGQARPIPNPSETRLAE